MLGIIGTVLLVSWVFDYALSFTPGFVKGLLLVLACLFLAVDFVVSKVRGHQGVDVTTPDAAMVK
jgi:hypothetical protein